MSNFEITRYTSTIYQDLYNSLFNKYKICFKERQFFRNKVKELNNNLLESIKREEFMEKELKESLTREENLDKINYSLQFKNDKWKKLFGEHAPESVKYILDQKSKDIEDLKNNLIKREKEIENLKIKLQKMEISKIKLAKDYVDLMN